MSQYRVTKNGKTTFYTRFIDTTTANECLAFLMNYLRGMMLESKDDISIDKVRVWFLPRPLATKMEKTTRDEVLAEPKDTQDKYIACFKAGLVYVRKKGGLSYQNLRKQ